ncbi:MAG: radical SAM family heme chaperone HemW [Chlorobi bacterium]|nr:radical SAM family heme chaperone HemW [Chlorobiota bacterium]
MAGIYFHIPFCHRKCGYCDFYKTTETGLKPQLISALIRELNDRKDYLAGEEIETIYFGGGTPSVLTIVQVKILLAEVYRLFSVAKNAEITFEANPDDLSAEYLSGLSSTKINRLSIGIQSFFDEDLARMGRRHNSTQAVECVNDAYRAGFKNISIDLIYGLPFMTSEKWGRNLEKALSLPVSHLSSYHLTYHEGTPFYKLRKEGVLREVEEEESINQFEVLIKMAESKGFIHYEISNFAKGEAFSRHNSSYWFGKKYLGVGPSAHSYDKASRQWNVSGLKQYLQNIRQDKPYFEKEILNKDTRFNEYILTSLRTMWGVSKKSIREQFGADYLAFFQQGIQQFIHSGYVTEKAGKYILTKRGFFISDDIIATLMY